MPNKKNVFSKEIELSEIVLKKTNRAFQMIQSEIIRPKAIQSEMIQKEDNDFMKKTPMENRTMQNKTMQNRAVENRKLWKTRAAAVAGVCILAAGGISAAAAIRHYWSRGMSGNIQASDTQQQELVEQNVAKVYPKASPENTEEPSLAVTNNGITIEPAAVVVDERFAYLSFRISGFLIGDGIEPGFDAVNTYLGDNPKDEASWINMCGNMYDGIVPDENGSPVYEDGTPLESDSEGRTICRYADENGDMEYIIQASTADENDSLLGKTMHVDFKDLGTLLNTEFTPAVEGNWNFEINLPSTSSSQTIPVGQKIEGTDFTMENIEISPISMKVNYSVGAAVEIKEDDLGIPQVEGVVLKSGKKIPYLIDGGGSGYTDESMSKAYQMAGYDRVIDVDDVAALIVLASNEKVEIPIVIE